MAKPLQKKGVERRKQPRGARGGTKAAAEKRSASAKAAAKRTEAQSRATSRSKPQPVARGEDSCTHCEKNLKNGRALFVEEEVGRVFCSEDCITAHFAPEIERLEKEYLRQLVPSDLSGEEREKFSHLRWITLEEPDEIWRQKTLTGDFRYTLISEFEPGSKKIWMVCICLFLRGEPSFLYLAFPTRNEAMVNHYRRGERMQWVKPERGKGAGKSEKASVEEGAQAGAGEESSPEEQRLIDGLADEWTEDETLRAQLIMDRRPDDIPASEFELYQACLEESLEAPDEVWTLTVNGGESKAASQSGEGEASEASESAEAPESSEAEDEEPNLDEFRIYHFIKQYSDEKPGYWYVIVAKETEDEEQIEILDAFPTRDPDLVQRYRRGVQEIGISEIPAASRLVH